MSDQLQDGRKPGFYIIDNELIDVYGEKIGPYGVAVYNALIRFAGRKENTFPTYETIAKRTGMSRIQAIRTVAALIEAGLISKEKRRNKVGGSTSNLYTIIDLKRDDSQYPIDTGEYPTDTLKVPVGYSPQLPVDTPPVSVSNPKKKQVKKTQIKEDSNGDVDSTRASVAAHAAPPAADAGWPEFVGAYCKACFQHDRVADLTDAQRGQLLAEAKRVRENGYTVEDLRLWWSKCWAIEPNWKWRKNKERPSPVDIRTGIAALTAIKADMVMLDEMMSLPRPVVERAAPLEPNAAMWKQLTTDYAQLNGATLEVDGDCWRITTIAADWCRVQITQRVERDLKWAGIVATVEFVAPTTEAAHVQP